MDSPRKICLFGFSVIEDKVGPSRYIKEWGARTGHVVSDFGFGGFHATDLPYMLDVVSESTDLTNSLIFLEVASSGIRSHFDEAVCRDRLRECFLRLARLNCSVAFINVARTDIDCDNDFFADFIQNYAENLGIPVLNLARQLREQARIDGNDVAAYLRDVVHTSELGARFYASGIIDFIENSELRTFVPPQDLGRQEIFVWPVGSLMPDQESVTLTRHGVPIHLFGIDEGARMELNFPMPANVLSIATQFGPKSGFMAVEAGSKSSRIACFDEFAYYDRLSLRRLQSAFTAAITLETLSTAPTAILRKGEWAPGPRVNFVSHLVVRV